MVICPSARNRNYLKTDAHLLIKFVDGTKGSFKFDGRNLIPICISQQSPAGRWHKSSCIAVAVGTNLTSLYLSFPKTTRFTSFKSAMITPARTVELGGGRLINGFIMNQGKYLVAFYEDSSDKNSYWVSLSKMKNIRDPDNYSVEEVISRKIEDSEWREASYTVRDDGRFMVIGDGKYIRIFDSKTGNDLKPIMIPGGCKDVFVCKTDIGLSCALIAFAMSQPQSDGSTQITRLCYKVGGVGVRSSPSAKTTMSFKSSQVQLSFSPTGQYISCVYKNERKASEQKSLLVHIYCVSCGSEITRFETLAFEWLNSNDGWVCVTPLDESAPPGIDFYTLDDDESDDDDENLSQKSTGSLSFGQGGCRQQNPQLCHPKTSTLTSRIPGPFNSIFISPDDNKFVLSVKGEGDGEGERGGEGGGGALTGLFNDLYFFARESLGSLTQTSRFICSPAEKAVWSRCSQYLATYKKGSKLNLWSANGARIWSGAIEGIDDLTWLIPDA